MARRNRRRRSAFLISVGAYAVLALTAGTLLRERLDEAIVSLLLLGLVPCVIAAWVCDGIRDGEVLRQAYRSTSMAVWSVRRQDQPVRFWLAIGVSSLLGVALLAFVAIGIWLRLKLAE